MRWTTWQATRARPYLVECIQKYNKHRLIAIVSEQKRYDDAVGVQADGKTKLSKRPDLVALKWTREAGEAADGAGKCFGTIAGVHVGFQFHSRAEMCVTGVHFPPVAGIDYMSAEAGAYTRPLRSST